MMPGENASSYRHPGTARVHLLAGCVLCASVALGCAERPEPNRDGSAALSPRTVEVWVTSADRSKLLARDEDVRLGPVDSGIAYDLTVNEAVTYQEMVGFGAAITHSSAWLIEALPEPERDSLLSALFSPTRGLGFSFTRLTMGASDFSLEHRTYHDLPLGVADPALERFSIDVDSAYLLPVVKRALTLNPDLRIMATPWSPPAWMKTTRSLIGGRLRADAYDALARYFLKFLEAYAAEGVAIYAISIQNEPHHEPADYPGMRMDPEERARFVGGHLGPLLARSGYADVLILEWDHNWDEPESPLAVLADSAARRYVDGVAWHCYAGDVAAQSRVHHAQPGLHTFFTECSGGQWAPDFGDNLIWNARTLIVGATRHWARGVLLWNLALDPTHGPHLGGCADCRGVVTIDTATGEWTPNEEYFALAHASRFVRPGAHRIHVEGQPEGMDAVAFRNPDGRKVLILVNAEPTLREISLRAGDRAFRYSLEPRSVATLVWP